MIVIAIAGRIVLVPIGTGDGFRLGKTLPRRWYERIQCKSDRGFGGRSRVGIEVRIEATDRGIASRTIADDCNLGLGQYESDLERIMSLFAVVVELQLSWSNLQVLGKFGEK